MLLFTRREGQSLILETSDGPIELKLAYLNGEHARIGIDAPGSVGIVRKEARLPGNREASPVELDLEEEPWWYRPEDMKT
jgi:sRNA-binding carbon storage regulator CsrA